MELSFDQKTDIGLKYVADLLEPVCPYGVKRLKSEGFYGPDRAETLERELDNVSLLLSALEADETAVLALRHELSGLKEVSGTLRNLADCALTEVELFELCAFCLRLSRVIPKAEALPGYEKLDGMAFRPVAGALAILDPAESGRLSFYVEDSRSPELSAARSEKRELERLLRTPGADREELLRRRMEAARREAAPCSGFTPP